MEDLLATAVIGSTYGVKGDLKIHPNNPDGSYLKKIKRFILEAQDGSRKPVDVENIRNAGGQLVVKFRGVDTPEEARRFARSVVLVPRSEAFPLREGEVYLADLVGCALVFEGKERAKVKSVSEGAQAWLLEAVTPDGKAHLVPYMDEYLCDVDTARKTITLRVDWILE